MPKAMNLPGQCSTVPAHCPFCALVGDSQHPARIDEFEHSVAFLNVDQTHPGRSILILKPHYEHFHQVPGLLFEGFNREMRVLENALWREMAPDRLNYAVLGNLVAHVHWHLIPRYRQDENWGAPPWPAKEITQLSLAGYEAMARRIRWAIRHGPRIETGLNPGHPPV